MYALGNSKGLKKISYVLIAFLKGFLGKLNVS